MIPLAAQPAKAPASSLHSKVAPTSLAWYLKVTLFPALRAAGELSIVAVGAVRSIVHG